jgi:hypothetical protein
MNIYNIIDKIFENSSLDLYDVELALSNDPTLIGFMMYDNYKTYFCNNYKQISLSIQSNISKIYMDTTLLEDFGYLSNDHALISIANLTRCHTIRSYQQTLVPKKITKNESINYTQITARSAQHCCINKKKARTVALNDNNIEIMAQILYKKGQKPNLKSDIGSVCQAIIFNVLHVKTSKKK